MAFRAADSVFCLSTVNDQSTAGVPRFSAATSHEQNDAYMQDFDNAYSELEALSLAHKYVPIHTAVDRSTSWVQ